MIIRDFLNMTGNNDSRECPAIRIFLVRHGQVQQNAGSIYLGQADIPLSAVGRIEAASAGEKLLEYEAKPKRIYTSDLERAKETADIISKTLGGFPVIPDKLFREMAMGTWDGELVEDIKAKFPTEYEKRGDDLRNYRTPGGENFYDLSSRVTREFHRIFAEDFVCSVDSLNDNLCQDPGDLVIVAHLGVITALLEELMPERQNIREQTTTGSVTVFQAPEWLWPEQARE